MERGSQFPGGNRTRLLAGRQRGLDVGQGRVERIFRSASRCSSKRAGLARAEISSWDLGAKMQKRQLSLVMPRPEA
jgi:hypothetical protein